MEGAARERQVQGTEGAWHRGGQYGGTRTIEATSKSAQGTAGKGEGITSGGLKQESASNLESETFRQSSEQFMCEQRHDILQSLPAGKGKVLGPLAQAEVSRLDGWATRSRTDHRKVFEVKGSGFTKSSLAGPKRLTTD